MLIDSVDIKWEEVLIAARMLAMKLNEISHLERYRQIYAMGRGGMVPARILSDLMGIKEVRYLDITKTDYFVASYSILCDEIYDTGKTYRMVHERIKNNARDIVFAFLFRRNIGYPPPDIRYGYLWIDDKYLIFPWEFDEKD